MDRKRRGRRDCDKLEVAPTISQSAFITWNQCRTVWSSLPVRNSMDQERTRMTPIWKTSEAHALTLVWQHCGWSRVKEIPLFCERGTSMAAMEEGACYLHTPAGDGKVHMCGGQWECGLWCGILGVMVVKVQGRLLLVTYVLSCHRFVRTGKRTSLL